MTRTFGRPEAGDTESTEVRVLEGSEVVLAFLDTAIDFLNVQEPAPHVPHAEGALTVDEAFHLPLFAEGSAIEIWTTRAGDLVRRQFRGRVDYAVFSAEDGTTKVIFQARGFAAALVDAPFKGNAGTTVDEVVDAIARGVGLASKTEHPNAPVSAWIDAASSYGALRLLATNFNAIVRTRDDVVEFVSSDVYLAKLQRPATIHLNAHDVKSSRTVLGRPIRK